jgi:hypothetical protein
MKSGGDRRRRPEKVFQKDFGRWYPQRFYSVKGTGKVPVFSSQNFVNMIENEVCAGA